VHVDEDQPASRRPTADDLRRWERALDAVAERERAERGVVEPVSVETSGTCRTDISVIC
jgi:hypothetical protein